MSGGIVSRASRFQGHDIFLCKLGLKGRPFELGGQYVYVALIDGALHTHATDPEAIPGRLFDPPFQSTPPRRQGARAARRSRGLGAMEAVRLRSWCGLRIWGCHADHPFFSTNAVLHDGRCQFGAFLLRGRRQFLKRDTQPVGLRWVRRLDSLDDFVRQHPCRRVRMGACAAAARAAVSPAPGPQGRATCPTPMYRKVLGLQNLGVAGGVIEIAPTHPPRPRNQDRGSKAQIGTSRRACGCDRVDREEALDRYESRDGAYERDPAFRH